MREREAREPETPIGVGTTALEVWKELLKLSDAERAAIFRCFCECGSTDLGCQCWNDE